MSGRAADVRGSGDDGDPRRPGSQRRQSQHRGQGPLWLHRHRQTDRQAGREITYAHLSSETERCIIWRRSLTGGFGRFFLLLVDLEPEKRLLRAARAALALATFLLGPVPRKSCLSTSTCHQRTHTEDGRQNRLGQKKFFYTRT